MSSASEHPVSSASEHPVSNASMSTATLIIIILIIVIALTCAAILTIDGDPFGAAVTSAVFVWAAAMIARPRKGTR